MKKDLEILKTKIKIVIDNDERKQTHTNTTPSMHRLIPMMTKTNTKTITKTPGITHERSRTNVFGLFPMWHCQ